MCVSVGFYSASFSTDFKQYCGGRIFDQRKTELSIATETINQTRFGQIAQSLSSQILLEIGGKRSIKRSKECA